LGGIPAIGLKIGAILGREDLRLGQIFIGINVFRWMRNVFLALAFLSCQFAKILREAAADTKREHNYERRKWNNQSAIGGEEHQNPGYTQLGNPKLCRLYHIGLATSKDYFCR
jgi:hypothetical protein